MRELLNKYYVYVLFRPWDGSPFYIGKGTGDRWRQHGTIKSSNAHLANIFKKAARLNLEIPRVRITNNLTEHDAFVLEMDLIKAIGRADQQLGPLVNKTDGGDGPSGVLLDAQARAKISASKLGRHHSNATKQKISQTKRGNSPAYNKGKSPSEQSRLRMSLAHQGKPNPNKGKSFSDQAKANMRAGRIGTKHSPETRMKMSLSQKRQWIIRKQFHS